MAGKWCGGTGYGMGVKAAVYSGGGYGMAGSWGVQSRIFLAKLKRGAIFLGVPPLDSDGGQILMFFECFFKNHQFFLECVLLHGFSGRVFCFYTSHFDGLLPKLLGWGWFGFFFMLKCNFQGILFWGVFQNLVFGYNFAEKLRHWLRVCIFWEGFGDFHFLHRGQGRRRGLVIFLGRGLVVFSSKNCCFAKGEGGV